MKDATAGGGTAPPSDIAARLGAFSARVRLAIGVLAGVVLALGHAPVGLPWSAFLALPVFVWLISRAPGPRGAAIAGWAVGFGYFVLSLHWIGHAFLVDADAFAWLLPVALTGLPAGLALFWALAAYAARRIADGGTPGATHDLRIAIILAGALTLTEAARGYVLTGFPWALPAYLWIDTPLAQLAAWVGPYGLTALTLLVGSLPVLGLAALPSHRTLGGAAAAAGAALFIGGWLAGNAREAAAPALPPEPTVIRLVQPNAPQRLKWDPAYVPLFYQRLIEGSAAPADPALGAADVVIWPETAVAFLPEREPEARAQMAAAAGAPLILGALHAFPDPEGDGGTAYTNALYVLDQGGEIAARYDKHHLVPFGEYMPFRNLFAALGLRQLAQHGLFRSGPGPATLALPGLAAFAPLICYEAIFPSEVAAAVDAGPSRPAYLLQITNDAWFGTWGGPQQHLAQARLRAIEQGLPLVRAANTGISAVIDSHGRVTAAIPLGQHGFLDAALPAATNPPLYGRLGDVPGYIFALLLFVARFLRSRT